MRTAGSTVISLEGRSAVVTGASRGIGSGIARRLAAYGAKVTVVARSEGALREVAAEIGGNACVTDLSNAQDVVGLFDRIGPQHILVNNAAIYQRPIPILTTDDEYWRAVIEVNLWAPYVLLREAARLMVDLGGGAIVNISSTAAQRAVPLVAPYCATKAALDQLTKVAALELAEHGIRVNGVAPGFIETQHSGAMLDARARDQVRSDVPLGRSGLPEEVGELAAFLVSPAAAYITGQVIACDGGSLSGSMESLRRFRRVAEGRLQMSGKAYAGLIAITAERNERNGASKDHFG